MEHNFTTFALILHEQKMGVQCLFLNLSSQITSINKHVINIIFVAVEAQRRKHRHATAQQRSRFDTAAR